jgi:hypothetical protein
VLADEPLQTALTDAVTFGQLPLGRARGEGRYVIALTSEFARSWRFE